MSLFSPIVKNRWVAGFLIVVVGFLFYHFLFLPLFSNWVLTRSTAADYHRVDVELGNLAKQIGLADVKDPAKDCLVLARYHFNTSVSCGAWSEYGYNDVPDYSIYKQNAANLKTLLKTNGWVVDNKSEYDNSPDKLLDIAFHKNIGSASCNLEISSQDQRIYINFYSCSHKIDLPDINLSTHLYGP